MAAAAGVAASPALAMIGRGRPAYGSGSGHM